MSRKGRSPGAVKESSGKVQEASAYRLRNHEVDGKAGDEQEIQEGSRKGCSPGAVKERSRNVPMASAHDSKVVVDLGVDDLEMSRTAHPYSAPPLPNKERKCHGKVVHRGR